MPNFWNRIINIGVTEHLPSEEIRKVRLLNSILSIGEIIFIVLIIKSLFQGLPEEYLVQALGAFLFLIPISLNYFRKYKTAKLLCLLIPIFYLSFLSIYWGSARGSQLIILAVTGIVVLFFERKSSIILLIILCSLAILTVEIYNFNYPPLYNPPNLEVAYLINIVITIIMIVVTVGIFKKENYSYQHQIAEINKKITQQHNKVVELNRSLSRSLQIIKYQKEANDETHKSLQDSINYAQTIQKSILTLSPTIASSLPEHFILFAPRDIVSGDFYYFFIRDNKIFAAAVDCTGHGVPGAFMSMIGYNLLQEAIETEKIDEPSYILNFLNGRIAYSLKQRDNNNYDGMDISLIVFDLSTYEVKFSGAKNSLIHISEEGTKRYKGDGFSIGGFTTSDHTFSQENLTISKGDCLYLLTDGFQDQFGGPKMKKFRSKKLINMLGHLHENHMKEQKMIITATLNAWKESIEQTDDILIVGLRA